MEDVTDLVLANVNDTMDESERHAEISEQFTIALVAAAVKDTHYTASVETILRGNEFYLFVYEIFTDVRLVGAPPSSIGKFGGDTDNWMWPRHTGDFSLFRIYADKNNEPAEYSPDNVPYQTQKIFSNFVERSSKRAILRWFLVIREVPRSILHPMV